VDCSHGNQIWELCKVKYSPLWLSGGGHCNLELYPDYIRHLKKFVSSLSKKSSKPDPKEITAMDETTSKGTEAACPDKPKEAAKCSQISRKSLDSRVGKSKTVDVPEKPRMSSDDIDKFRRRRCLVW
jgi:abhydrolase domain-containing protein 17